MKSKKKYDPKKIATMNSLFCRIKSKIIGICAVVALNTNQYFNAQEILFSESFENCSNFSTTSTCNWQFRDLDQSQNIHLIMEADFPNNDASANSFIVIDQNFLQPSMWMPFIPQAFQAQNGSKYLASIANYGDNSGFVANNELLISPQITLGAANNKISFWAKNLRQYELNPSRITLGISTTGTATDNFQIITSAPIEISASSQEILPWVEYTLDIPSTYNNQNVHFSLNIISNTYFLMIDNINVTAQSSLLVEEQNMDDIQIYPNPTSNEISFDGFDLSTCKGITFYSITGKIEKKSAFMQTISIEDLATGTYLVELEFEGKKVIKRINKL
ncbi:MAG: choice-of-anchor J domain-containing protein [Flavobacteriia bacterium]|jgi:hypothetical protein